MASSTWLGRGSLAILRLVQIMFAAIVLGTAVAAAKWQHYNSIPFGTCLAVSAGAFGLSTALIGLAVTCSESLGGVFMQCLDICAMALYMVGGLTYAISLAGTNCSDGSEFKTWHNRILSGGCKRIGTIPDQTFSCGRRADSATDFSNIERRCRIATTDTAFMFLGGVTSLLALTVFISQRQGRPRPGPQPANQGIAL